MIQHKQLLLKGYIKNVPNKSDSFQMKLWIKRFIMKNGMKIQEEPIVSYVHDKGNKGMTACCLLKTSHMAFHIWDEQDPALIQFDFYTCGDLNVDKAVELINKKFSFTNYEYKVIDREKNIGWIITQDRKD